MNNELLKRRRKTVLNHSILDEMKIKTRSNKKKDKTKEIKRKKI